MKKITDKELVKMTDKLDFPLTIKGATLHWKDDFVFR